MKKLTTLILAFICLNVYSQIPTNGLVGFYPFNGNTKDSSALGRIATANGCTFEKDRFGNSNSAIKLNGKNDSIRFKIPEFAPIKNDFSLSFWIKTNSPEIMNLFSSKQYPDDTTNNFEFQLSSNSRLALENNLQIFSGTYLYWNGTGTPSTKIGESPYGKYHDGEWEHFVLRRKSSKLELWHNKNLMDTAIYSENLGDIVDFAFGSGPQRFKGTLDDVAFYGISISDQDIFQLFHDRAAIQFTSPKSTDAYVQGDFVDVYWIYNDKTLGDSVKLEYRINETGPWLMTTQNQLVDWIPFKFQMNYPIGTKVEFRVTDIQNPALVAYSGTCIVSVYKWTNVTKTIAFTNRDGVGLLSYKGKLWALGGWDPPYHEPYYTHSEVWNSVDGVNWTFVNEAPWPARHVSGWLIHKDAIWLIGGDPQSGSLTDVWRSTDGINWEKILDEIPNYQKRSMHHVANSNGNMYSFGGNSVQYIDSALNEVWKSNDGVNWSQLAIAPWSGRGSVLNSVVDDQNAIWFLGGGRLQSFRDFNEVWKFSNEKWELVNESAPWGPRHWHNTAWFDHKMWVMCGSVRGLDNDETWYSADGLKWYELKNAPHLPRHAASATVHDSSLFLMAAIESNDVWKLQKQQTMGVAKINDSKKSTVYPNPSTTTIQLDHLTTSTSYVIVNSVGKKVQFGETSGVIDVSNLSSGVYFVEINNSSIQFVRN